jgi:hypothetical protein
MRYVDACEHGWWHLQLCDVDEPDKVRFVTYRCRSWRHEGPCRLWRGAQDFARIAVGMSRGRHWLHLVLTYAQRGRTLSPLAFTGGLSCWDKLRKRLTRLYGYLSYVMVWEVHRSGWPHCHLALSNERLATSATADPLQNWETLVRQHAVLAGFGRRGWLEPLRSERAMSGYMVKLARELTGSGVKSQIPIAAPRHFRRLRASRGLLPPRHSDPGVVGRLLFCSVNDWLKAATGGSKQQAKDHP